MNETTDLLHIEVKLSEDRSSVLVDIVGNAGTTSVLKLNKESAVKLIKALEKTLGKMRH